jgi:hypothetical protein
MWTKYVKACSPSISTTGSSSRYRASSSGSPVMSTSSRSNSTSSRIAASVARARSQRLHACAV